MADTTPRGWTRYKRHVSNTGRGFSRGHGNSYGRGRGCGFNAMKKKVRGKCEYLGGVVY